MSLLLRIIAIVAPIFGTLLLWAAQVGPEDAVSNLAKWAKLAGIESPPGWLSSQSADTWATIGGCGAIAVGLLAILAWVRARQRATNPEGVISANAVPPNPNDEARNRRLLLRKDVQLLEQQNERRRLENERRKLEAASTGLAATSFAQPQDKFYSAAEKERVGDLLFALSEVLSKNARVLLDRVSEAERVGQHAHPSSVTDVDALLEVLQQVNDRSVDMNIALFDKGGVKDTHSAYLDEFNFVVQGDSDTRMAPLNIARNGFADAVKALKLAMAHNDQRLNESILGTISRPKTDFSNASSAFRSWVDDCKRRVDVLRRSLVNR